MSARPPCDREHATLRQPSGNAIHSRRRNAADTNWSEQGFSFDQSSFHDGRADCPRSCFTIILPALAKAIELATPLVPSNFCRVWHFHQTIVPRAESQIVSQITHAAEK